MNHKATRLDRFRNNRTALIGGIVAALALSAGAVSATAAGSGSAAAGLAAAKAAVAEYSKAPTALPVERPLPAAPKRGKSVVFLQCEVAQCTQGGDGFRSAAAAIGWKVKTLDWQSDEPATLVSDMKEALTLQPKPYAVSISGLPEVLWQQEVPAYAKAGVLLIPWSVGPVTYNKTVFANILGPPSVEEQGRLLADWFIVNSKGKGNVLLQNVSQYPTIGEVATGFQDEVAAHCPGCKLTMLDVTGTEVAANQVTSTIVSALQRDSSTTYVMSADVALAPGLPEAIQAAGLKVKIIGGAAIAPDLQQVASGQIAAAMATNQYFNGWQMIDALARHAAGLPVSKQDGGSVQQILTKANVESAGTSYQVPKGYPELFKKLWHVG